MSAFKNPPVMQTISGELRKAGFELEYGNVGVTESVNIVQQLYGGNPEKQHRFAQKVTGTSLGDFMVELDLRFLTDETYKHISDKLGLRLHEIKFGETTLEAKMEDALENFITRFIPYEVATPPVAFPEIYQFEKLREALYEHHAQGTEAFPTNAFGTHINIEIPDPETTTLLKYLRAFLLLYPWLLQAGHTDFTRLHLTSFINPFPEAYNLLVLQPTYQPDLETFITDYHTHNPDRNRPLDLYPLFASLKPAIFRNFENLGKVKPRNAFHYRLPNSWVSRADWSLAQEWNNWVAIEELANDPNRLEAMQQAYLAMAAETLIGFESKWAKNTELWLS